MHPMGVDVSDESVRSMFTIGIAALLGGVGYLIRTMRKALVQLQEINRAVDGDRRLRLPGLLDRVQRIEERLANGAGDHAAIGRIERRLDEVHESTASTQQMLRDHVADNEAHRPSA
jgi:hypothetical protein